MLTIVLLMLLTGALPCALIITVYEIRARRMVRLGH